MPQGNAKLATILFVDLVGSSDAASFMGTNDYSDHLKHFQDIINDAKESLSKQDEDLKDDENNLYKHEVRGDEGFFLFASAINKKNRDREIEKDIFDALKLALFIKYRWQLDEKNIRQIRGNKKPFEIAIGINSGIVSFTRENNAKGKNKPEGYAINLAKRIEGEARKGTYSRIFVGETTYGLYSDSPGENLVRFKKQELAPLKGIAGDIRIYEIASVSIEDEEEKAILYLPEEFIENSEITDYLKETRKFFNATQDTWLGNVYCNVKWTQIQRKIDKGGKVNKELLDIIDMARKLVEFDSNFSAWKVHLGQMVLDYFKYSLIGESTPESTELNEEDIALVKDTMDILKTLISHEPYELDARLTLGRFYLESMKIGEESRKKLVGESESGESLSFARRLSIDQFRRIIVWDEDYEDAYYYLARALVREKDRAWKRGVRKCLSKYASICREQGQGKNQIKEALTSVINDDWCKLPKDKIKDIITSILNKIKNRA